MRFLSIQLAAIDTALSAYETKSKHEVCKTLPATFMVSIVRFVWC